MEIMEEVKPSNSQEKESNKELKERVWAESKKIWRIAFPSMLTKITQFGMLVVTQGFIGHIGEVELAAFALVQIITVRFVQGIVVRLNSFLISTY